MQSKNLQVTNTSVKSLDIIIPINERGNSSSTLRMVHRQWYNKVQKALGKLVSKWIKSLKWTIQFDLDTEEPLKAYITQNNIRKSTEVKLKLRLRFILSGKSHHHLRVIKTAEKLCFSMTKVDVWRNFI